MNILYFTIPMNVLIGYYYIQTHNYISLLLMILLFIINVIGVYDVFQKKHTLWRNFPVLGRFRWLAEDLRPKISQYFVEDDINGRPIPRDIRSLVYQRSKGDSDKVPFGTQHDLYTDGRYVLKHSMYPKKDGSYVNTRCTIKTKHCEYPYSASVFNISAMSYGSLSPTAIEALNLGAKMGNFYHNTGEGGLSSYHKSGGDVVYQIGTGYFGCGSDVNGTRVFDSLKLRKLVFEQDSKVKMIEIKISQGAKPSLGGILPKEKITNEIAEIRGIGFDRDVVSPSGHNGVNNPYDLVFFIKKVRESVYYKLPVGIKLCIGNMNEFTTMLDVFVDEDMYPDFITIDGAEGGTGAATFEFTNYVGLPLEDALPFVRRELDKRPSLSDIKVIASGKVASAFDIFKNIALGADITNAARSFMLSLGCIQARICSSNKCPVGVATQNKKLYNGIDPTLKSARVYNYHRETVHALDKILLASGISDISEINSDMLMVRKDGKLIELSKVVS